MDRGYSEEQLIQLILDLQAKGVRPSQRTIKQHGIKCASYRIPNALHKIRMMQQVDHPTLSMEGRTFLVRESARSRRIWKRLNLLLAKLAADRYQQDRRASIRVMAG